MNKSIVVAVGVVGLIGAGIVLFLSDGQSTEKLLSDPSTPSAEYPWLPGNQPDLAADDHAGHDHSLSGPEADDEKEKPRPKIAGKGPYPKAEVPETLFDFGRQLLHSEPGQHDFTIRNTGEADLELVAGEATCQCTSFDVNKARIAPGEEAIVHIRWKAERRDVTFRHGGPVYTNDPENPEITFNVTGAIDEAVEILPSSQWDVGNVYADRNGKVQTAFASRMVDSFEIESIEADSEFITVETTPMSQEMLARDDWRCGYSLTVTVSNEIPNGSFQGKVSAKLSCSDEKLIIPVTARKQGRIRCLPMPGTFFDPEIMLLKLGVFSASESRSGKILLLVDQEGLEGPLEITNLEASPGFVKATIEPDGDQSGPKRRYILTVEVPAGKPRVKHTMGNLASLRIETNHPKGETIPLDILFSTN
ncbi:MAG: DUF1573 domain-containing protein [Planctomycetaceae bacterium]|nr:DUF1573 domain-containing protein [Planctomycetaceae bacterium]